MALTTIQASDLIKNSRTTINNNFTDLENRKVNNTGNETIGGEKTFSGTTTIQRNDGNWAAIIRNTGGGYGSNGAIYAQVQAASGARDILRCDNNSTTVFSVRDDAAITMTGTINGIRMGSFAFSSATEPRIGIKSDSPNGSILLQTGGTNGIVSVINSSRSAELFGISAAGNISFPGTANGQTIGDSGRITPTLLNSWVDFDPAFSSCQFRKIGNIVYVKGLIKSGTAGDVFLLPSGYRPALYSHLAAIDAAPIYPNTAIRITGAGYLQCLNHGVAWTSVECSFIAA